MNFTACELRNKNNALLRRVQRQMDNKPIEEDFSKLFKEKKEKDFKVEEKKQTKLGLYKNRSSGRW